MALNKFPAGQVASPVMRCLARSAQLSVTPAAFTTLSHFTMSA